MSRAINPLLGWTLCASDIDHVGHDLRRPECILAEPDGTLWCADARGGVMRIAANGHQQLIVQKSSDHFDLAVDAKASLLTGTLPNGLAFDREGNFLIANFGTDVLEIMTRDGHSRVLYDSIDGMPIGKVNFVLRDRSDRIWLTVSTRTNPWSDALRPDLADGYIALLDNRGLRVIADGFAFSNEIRLDEAEDYLYVAETSANHVSRLKVAADGALSGREIYGPSDLGAGLIDGITFDAFGNLWGAMVLADRLIAITPEGDVLTLLDDGKGRGIEQFEKEFHSSAPASFETLSACGGTLAPWMASLKTVHVGSLKGTTLPTFKSPVAGLPMVHWR